MPIDREIEDAFGHIPAHAPTDVIVDSDLNEGRYRGRRGKVIETLPNGRFVIQLEKWTPGWESGDGKLWLRRDEFRYVD